MKKGLILFFLMVFLFPTGCRQGKVKTHDILRKDNLIAWCIVPFDAMDRTPLQRAEMLNELGIGKFAYDYRDRHLPYFREEIRQLKAHDIELTAVWLWIQDGGDSLLDSTSEFIVRTVEETGTKTTFWVSFPDIYFKGLNDEEKLQKAVDVIGKLNERVEKAGCSIALYNHGDWFGEPENQVKIIKAIGSDHIGIVYNFHHAQHQVDRFPTLFDLMQPYLVAVNINGMTKDGPMILPVGQGEEELGMIRYMIKKGYDGPIGILGHTEGEDIRVVLERNLDGVEKLRKELGSF